MKKLNTLNSFLIAILILCTSISANAQFIDVAADFGMNIPNDNADEGSGASTADFNGDGWDDVSMATTNDGPRFWQNDQNGGFTEVDLGIEVNLDVDYNMLIWVDYDNDGDKDLFLSGQEDAVYLFRNDGSMNFEDVALSVGLDVENTGNSGACWGDINNDGLLDLYLTRYHYFFQTGYQYENRLFKQELDGTFTDISLSSGTNNESRNTYHAIMWDYNEDGWLDIFVLNDLLNDANYLFENNGDETFSDVSEAAGLDAVMNAMSGTVGDFDGDEDMDLFVSNTGEGNHLYRNLNNGSFEQVGTELGVAANSTCWGAIWTDFNNDGWQDLFTGAAPLNDLLTPEQFMFQNMNGEEFEDVTIEMELDEDVTNSYAVCQFDFDQDGREDFFISPGGSLGRLYHNQVEAANNGNWVKLEMHGVFSNRDAIGTKVKVYCDTDVYYRSYHCGEGYISQHSLTKHVGLGSHDTIDSLVIEWPRGLVETHYDIPVNQKHEYTEGSTIAPSFPEESELFICSNGSAWISIEGPYTSVVWSDGTVADSLEVSDEGQISALVTHESGISFQTETLTVSYFETANPIFTITPPSCNGDENAVIALSDSNVEISSIEWLNYSETDTLTGIDAGVYFYQGIDINGCSFFGDETVEESEVMELSMIGDQYFELDCPFTWFGELEVTGGVEPFEYEWEITEATFENEFFTTTENEFSCLQDGLLTVTVTDAYGCEQVYEEFFGAIVGVQEQEVPGVSLLRNNGNGNLHFVNSNVLKAITVYDLNGRVILSESNSFSGIQIPNAEKGIYLIEMHTAVGSKVEKYFFLE